MITAEEARKKLSTEANIALSKEKDYIEREVNKAIAAGKNLVQTKKLTEIAIVWLKSLGYSAKNKSSYDCRDQFSEDWCDINW